MRKSVLPILLFAAHSENETMIAPSTSETRNPVETSNLLIEMPRINSVKKVTESDKILLDKADIESAIGSVEEESLTTERRKEKVLTDHLSSVTPSSRDAFYKGLGIRTIQAVITGQECDILILALILRFAERPLIDITLYLGSNFKSLHQVWFRKSSHLLN